MEHFINIILCIAFLKVYCIYYSNLLHMNSFKETLTCSSLILPGGGINCIYLPLHHPPAKNGFLSYKEILKNTNK